MLKSQVCTDDAWMIPPQYSYNWEVMQSWYDSRRKDCERRDVIGSDDGGLPAATAETLRACFAEPENGGLCYYVKSLRFPLGCGARLRYWVLKSATQFRKFERTSPLRGVFSFALLSQLATCYLFHYGCERLVNVQ